MVMKGYKGFLFGCDPEFFIFNAEGKPVPAPGILPGTKAEPHKVPGGAIQVDGLAGELNINPVNNFNEFSANIDLVIESVKTFLPDKYYIKFVPSVVFSQEDFDKVPDENKQLGCDPDFDAWTGLINAPPEPKDPLMRCAGGHLHTGWPGEHSIDDEQHLMNCRDLCRQFDWYLAAWALGIDRDKRRRELYGKAGAFRPKTYGCEYRTLSNFWVGSRTNREYVWNRMQQAIIDIKTSFMPEVAKERTEDLIASINTSKRNKELEELYHFPIREL